MPKHPDDVTLWKEFRTYFDAFVVQDLRKSLDAKLEVGTIILTTVGIECLSGYYAGEEAERKHFVSFMQRFMSAYAVFADDIYACVRNGLAHDYVIKVNPANRRTFVFQRDHGEPHLSPTPVDPNVIYLNRTDYANDFLEAQRLYFESVGKTETLWEAAMRRLKSQKGFLTVRPLNQLVVRPKEKSSEVSPPSGSAMGSTSTGTGDKPCGDG